MKALTRLERKKQRVDSVSLTRIIRSREKINRHSGPRDNYTPSGSLFRELSDELATYGFLVNSSTDWGPRAHSTSIKLYRSNN